MTGCKLNIIWPLTVHRKLNESNWPNTIKKTSSYHIITTHDVPHQSLTYASNSSTNVQIVLCPVIFCQHFTLMSVNALCQSVKNRVQGWWLIVPLKTMTIPEGKGRVRLLPLCCIYYFLQRKTKTTTLTTFWSDIFSCIKELRNDDSEASSIKVCLLVQELLGFLFIVVQFSLSVCTAGITIVRKDI